MEEITKPGAKAKLYLPIMTAAALAMDEAPIGIIDIPQKGSGPTKKQINYRKQRKAKAKISAKSKRRNRR